MKETVSIAPNECAIQEGSLALIAAATIALGPLFPPVKWLDPDLLSSFLDRRPVFVRFDSAGNRYEVVGGFLSFSIVREVLPPDRLFQALLTKDKPEKLVRAALLELISGFLASGLSGPSSHGHLYRELRKLAKALKAEYPSFDIPSVISSSKSLREALGLSVNQAKQPRVRHSTLSRIMEAS